VRLFGDRLRSRFGDFSVMAVSLVVAVAGFSGLGLARGFWPSALAFAAVGFGLALIFPCLFALAARLVPHARASAMSYTALVGGVPRVALPWTLGVLAASMSVHGVFAACAVFTAATLGLIFLAYAQAGERLRAT
jgi:MFS family permease